MKIGIIIQARLNSSRLPQKIILPFFNKKGLLEIMLQRLLEAQLNIPIIIATTTKEADDLIEEIGLKYGTNVFRGEENNVLDRFIQAASCNRIEKIIRICADNPLLDINTIKYLITAFNTSDADYWCYCKKDLTPTIKTHYGFWAEGVSLMALKKVTQMTNAKIYQEHVTNYIYANSNIFKIHFELIPKSIEEVEDIRLTIDTLNDFKIVQEIYTELIKNKIQLTSNEILKLVRARPEWLNVMKQEIINNTK